MSNPNSIPDRSTWFEVQAVYGLGTHYERTAWCHENCQARWLEPGRMAWVWIFESHRDAVLFKLKWGQ